MAFAYVFPFVGSVPCLGYFPHIFQISVFIHSFNVCSCTSSCALRAPLMGSILYCYPLEMLHDLEQGTPLFHFSLGPKCSWSCGSAAAHHCLGVGVYNGVQTICYFCRAFRLAGEEGFNQTNRMNNRGNGNGEKCYPMKDVWGRGLEKSGGSFWGCKPLVEAWRVRNEWGFFMASPPSHLIRVHPLIAGYAFFFFFK